ncbi:MAG: EAL domain-containing protein [Pseudomonadota bacterium]
MAKRPLIFDPRREAALRIGRQARRGYSFSFLLIGVLAATSFALTMGAIRDQSTHIEQLHLARAKEAAIQQVGLLAARYQSAQEPGQQAQLRNALLRARDDVFELHERQVRGDVQLGIPPMTAPELRQLYFDQPDQVDFQIRRFVRLTDLVLAAPRARVNDDLIFQIVEMAGQSLPNALQRVVRFHEDRANGAVSWLGELAIWLFGATLSVLAGAGLFVFRPLVQGAVTRTLALFDAEDEIKFTAEHDRLTGLPNRLGVRELFEQRVKFRPGQHVTALQIDLINFATLNETHGHDIGDTVLKTSAKRLKEIVRNSDIVARIGGDDFAVVLPNGADQADVLALCDRINTSLSAPIAIGEDDSVRISCHVGVAQEDAEHVDYERLMTSAGIALHDAQSKGNDAGVTVYAPTMRTELEERDRTLQELEEGLERGDVFPFFQPQIRAETGAISGFEALVRWQHPERGLIPPFKFLDVAEEGGLGMRLGEIVLRRALEALQRWDAAGFSVPQVGVNFSSGQLQDDAIVEHIKLEVDRLDLEPKRLGIEILETVMIENDDNDVVKNVLRLKAAGFQIELDDFGTGHASISNLRRFKVDRVKIDRGFVTSIDSDRDLRKMTLAMVKMAEGLGIEALAEGVETPGERETLISMGVHDLQGYGIGRPMPFAETLGWLTENQLYQQTRQRRRVS